MSEFRRLSCSFARETEWPAMLAMRVKVCAPSQLPLAVSESCKGVRSEWAYIIVGLLALGAHHYGKFG